MSISSFARRLLPESTVTSLARASKRMKRARIERLPVLTEERFAGILSNDLGLVNGDTVYIHSSTDQLNLGFPFYRILSLVQEVIGGDGTVLLPTYPNRRPVSSHEYLLRGEVFDVRRTPSYTGLLSEFARRQKNAIRSLHPTKSVCAIGPRAHELTATHRNSPYPYDTCSPYYKLIDYNAKIVGLGVWTQYLSFVYCADDALKDEAPVHTYFPEKFAARCINYDGQEEVVETYAHDMRQVVHDVPQFMKTYIPPEVCRDIVIDGMKFFTADAARLFDLMLPLAKEGITVYPRSVYKNR